MCEATAVPSSGGTPSFCFAICSSSTSAGVSAGPLILPLVTIQLGSVIWSNRASVRNRRSATSLAGRREGQALAPEKRLAPFSLFPPLPLSLSSSVLHVRVECISFLCTWLLLAGQLAAHCHPNSNTPPPNNPQPGKEKGGGVYKSNRKMY